MIFKNEQERLQHLLDAPEWSGEDRQWLLQYLENSQQEELKNLLQESFRAELPPNIKAVDSERLLELIHQKLNRGKLIPNRFWTKSRLLAACCLIGVVLISSVVLFKKPGNDQPVSVSPVEAAEIIPGRNAAVLTLSDGRSVLLDQADNGTLAKQEGVQIIKLNDQVTYSSPDYKSTRAEPIYNSIATANGNQYQLMLADGTRVWLNASSSLRFPVRFDRKERRVEVTGEAYFEVAKNKQSPFVVQILSRSGIRSEVRVLGTHFNVNAYEDEGDVRTTLLEGSVRITSSQDVQMLLPGQQSRLTADQQIVLQKNVDIDQVMAWKEGYFWFNNTDVHTLMKQVARWYGVDVVFEGKVTEEGFSGKIPKNLPLSKLLAVLELNEVHFKKVGNKLIVLP